MPGFGAGVVVGHQNHLVSAQIFEEFDHRRERDQFCDGPTGELDALQPPLMNAVVHVGGFKLSGLFFEVRDMIIGEQIGDDQVAFDFELPNALPECELAPVVIVYAWDVYRLSG